MSKKPTAFRLDDPDVLVEEAPTPKSRGKTSKPKALVAPDTELEKNLSPDETGTALAPAPEPAKRGFRWAGLFGVAFGALVSLALGLWVTELVEALFLRAQWLGWFGLGLAGLTGLALLVLVLRELIGIRRLTRVTELREAAETAAANDDMGAAKRVVARVMNLYRGDATTAKGRVELSSHAADIIDGRDRLKLAERHLLTAKDAEARGLILGAAKRVTAVTAISPRALVDIVYVFYESLRLIRRLATLYGGRPGGLGTAKLARMVLGHLALTGGVAMTDSLVQQLIGHGLAAKLSARLGEGVVNGLMTARIGLAALDVCRPLPHLERSAPALTDIMGELTTFGSADKQD